MKNPFILSPYTDKSLFCDRESELKTLFDYVTNEANVTLISPRRMGKTGLIYRLFDEISTQKLDFETFYVDIYATQSIDEFIKVFSETIIQSFQKKTSLLKKAMKVFSGVKPVLSFDELTGNPQISLSYNDNEEKMKTLRSIFDFLENHDKKVIVAFDEFQQVREYRGVNMEAILRTHIQKLTNVRFIFCGSKKHLMFDIFANARNPFYASTSYLYLDKIDNGKYFDFIEHLFSEHGKTIESDAIEFVLKFTKRHTFYTQSLCHFIFQNASKKVSLQFAKEEAARLIALNENIYLQYRSLLTPQQWNYLKAIAKEGVVVQPTASSFLRKYEIGTPANSQRILTSLIAKDLILDTTTKEHTEYSVSDVFLSRWLEA
ncbi:MAG: ATP-binding protein [Bacteroidales bacterium]|nr:ATP-binding protein [Bacteroidales bacterium]